MTVLEQETASIIRFILDQADPITPYYESIPESFFVPAVYFPSPEIAGGNDTLNSYSLTYSWFITFHHSTSEDAFELARRVLSALKGHRNIVSLISEAGLPLKRGLRIESAEVKVIDTGVAQLSLTFISRRDYDEENESVQMTGWVANINGIPSPSQIQGG